jgi:tetratricopeptide (TPR) repeat protein
VVPAGSTLSPAQVLEARDNTLAGLGLLRPLAASQREALRQAPGNSVERRLIAERLGSLYARMLAGDIDADERKSLERHAGDLLTLVPEAATPALRLELLTAQYRPVEEIVERRELLLGEKSDAFEAERVLREVVPKFITLANELATTERAVYDKRQRGSESDAEIEKTDTLLRSTRELKATARFRAGWACYYLALLTGEKAHAHEAMQQFGAVLNAAPGRPATVDRLPTDMLEHEAIAKAALGCALASSLLENGSEPVRWLQALEGAENLAPSVKTQLLRRSITIYASVGAWTSLDLLLARYRGSDRNLPPTLLSVADARALAVASLSALREGGLTQALSERANSAAQTALGDLIARGEVAHVVAMVKTFGTAIISEQGFVNNYVRALCAFDDARAAHKLANPDTADATTGDSASLTLYRQASQLVTAALSSLDAAKFPQQSLGALMCKGLALLYSGEYNQAADTFELAFSLPPLPEPPPGVQSSQVTGIAGPSRRDALRLAVVSLSRAIDVRAKAGAPVESDVEARRERLVTVFIQTYPNTRDANLMLYSRFKSGKALTREDIDALLAVTSDDPIYEAARGIAADALYKLFRQSAGRQGVDTLALRFADVAEELLRVEFTKLTAPFGGENKGQSQLDAANVAMNRGRRIVEALLACKAPDVARAQAILHIIDSISTYTNAPIAGFADELTFRRFQIAYIRNDQATADRELTRLRGREGPFAQAAERYGYQRAVETWRVRPDDTQAAESVISTGSRLLIQSNLADSTRASVRDAIAGAAFALFKANGQDTHRTLALRMDGELIDSGVTTHASLRRIAELRESLGDWPKAIQAWLALLAAHGEGTQAWYEARYESLRLTLKIDRDQAATIFTQFKALHPKMGGSVWDAKFADMAAELSLTSPPSSSGGVK